MNGGAYRYQFLGSCFWRGERFDDAGRSGGYAVRQSVFGLGGGFLHDAMVFDAMVFDATVVEADLIPAADAMSVFGSSTRNVAGNHIA